MCLFTCRHTHLLSACRQHLNRYKYIASPNLNFFSFFLPTTTFVTSQVLRHHQAVLSWVSNDKPSIFSLISVNKPPSYRLSFPPFSSTKKEALSRSPKLHETISLRIHRPNVSTRHFVTMPRPRKQTRPARQVARPGCCYELPITINDDDQVAPSNENPKPVSNHTAEWMQALASGRFGSGANRPAVDAAQAQGARVSSMVSPRNASYRKANDLQKRALRDVDCDNDEPSDGGAKRLRLSGGDSYATRTTPQTINAPSLRTTPYNLTKTAEEKHDATTAAPKFGLRTSQCQINPDNVIARDIQVSQEQTRLRGRARAAELLEQQNQPDYLRTMWQDHDRHREVAEGRLMNQQRERREEAQKQAQETEEKRLGVIAGIEASIRSMWDADLLDARGDPKIRPGQLSAAGQQRVREREERLGRSRF